MPAVRASPRAMRRFVSGTAAVLFFCFTGAAQADDDLARIDALLAVNRVAEALPVAVARAVRLETDAPAWQKVLTIAGWSSNADAALLALEHLVALQPSNRDWRLALAQRLLWAKKTAAALPHAEWLLNTGNERSGPALEVIAWILLDQGRSNQARNALGRWIEASPADPHPRWILADATHWSVRWTEARAQYDVLVGMPAEATKAQERLALLRHDHPNEVHVEGLGWRDNFKVSYTAGAIGSTTQLGSRFVLLLRTEMGAWSQTVLKPAPGGLTIKNVSEDLRVGGATARLRYELWDAVAPEAFVGFEGDSANNLTPTGGLGARLSIAGSLFGRVQVDHDRHRVSLNAARQDITRTGPSFLLHWEATRWVFASSEGMIQQVSDGNLRSRGLLILGAHNPNPIQIEPRVFAQYDRYRDGRAGAVPYFTPTEPWTYGADLVARVTSGTVFRAEGQIGFAVQGGKVAVRPGGLVSAELAQHVRASVGVAYIGSPQYNQTRVDASVGYVF